VLPFPSRYSVLLYSFSVFTYWRTVPIVNFLKKKQHDVNFVRIIRSNIARDVFERYWVLNEINKCWPLWTPLFSVLFFSFIVIGYGRQETTNKIIIIIITMDALFLYLEVVPKVHKQELNGYRTINNARPTTLSRSLKPNRNMGNNYSWTLLFYVL